MTTLAIFGDSFAEVLTGKPDWMRAWPNLLGSDYTVTNYGWSASSLEYTYKQFIHHQHLYERVVVLVTSPYRFGHEPMTIDNKPIWITSHGTLESLHHSGKGLLSVEDNRRLDALRLYWGYLQQLSGIHLTAPLILAEIRRQRPDAIIIPCFPWPWPAEVFDQCASMRDLQGACLRGIREDYACDEEFWHLKIQPYKEESMLCHMTLEGNQLMAQEVLRHLDQGWSKWSAQWPRAVPAARPWHDYISENNPSAWEGLSQLQRFVNFFSNRPGAR